MKHVSSSELESEDSERPSTDIINDSIPLALIGRNRNRCWVAIDADTRTGGLFIFKQSAIRFADRHARKKHIAKMFVSKPLELKGRNRGNPFASSVAFVAKGLVGFQRLISVQRLFRSN
jgi:hypothetical protein